MTREEAMAKAREFRRVHPTPGHLQETEDEGKRWEADYATRLQFEADFDEWLQLRMSAAEEAPDDEQAELCRREDELMQLILTAPVPYEWMIFRKLEVVNYCITKHGEASWSELLALTALDAIKADILRMSQMREREFAKPRAA
ncbi:MAG: hypothetical protein WDN46_06840 [Methylocella sp.]